MYIKAVHAQKYGRLFRDVVTLGPNKLRQVQLCLLILLNDLARQDEGCHVPRVRRLQEVHQLDTATSRSK
jgi:hypothetical protein